MRAVFPGLIGPLLLLLVHPGGARPQAPALAHQKIDELKSRIQYYMDSFGEMEIPPGLSLETLDQLGQQTESQPAAVLKILEPLVAMLDRLALPVLKQRIHEVGQNARTVPTSDGNFLERKLLLIEFATVLERLGVPVNFYFPKGRDQLVLTLGLQNEATYRKMDEHFKLLAKMLALPGGGTGGGAGGGGGGGGSDPVSATGPGPIDPLPAANFSAPGSSPDGSALEDFRRGSRDIQRILTYSAGILLVVGSLIALFLPRVRTAMLNAVHVMWPRGAKDLMLDEDVLKKVRTFLGRGDFRKALLMLERVDETRASPDILCLRAACHFRLLQREEALRLLQLFEREAVSVEDLARLAGACEELGELEQAVPLYETIERRDPRNHALARKVANLKRLIAERARPTGSA